MCLLFIYILLHLKQESLSRGVNIKFGSEKDSKEFCDSFEEWRKDGLVRGMLFNSIVPVALFAYSILLDLYCYVYRIINSFS